VGEALVPEEKLFLSKSEVLIGGSEDILAPGILVRSSEAEAPRP
jgi:hypothetical protein